MWQPVRLLRRLLVVDVASFSVLWVGLHKPCVMRWVGHAPGGGESSVLLPRRFLSIDLMKGGQTWRKRHRFSTTKVVAVPTKEERRAPHGSQQGKDEARTFLAAKSRKGQKARRQRTRRLPSGGCEPGLKKEEWLDASKKPRRRSCRKPLRLPILALCCVQ